VAIMVGMYGRKKGEGRPAEADIESNPSVLTRIAESRRTTQIVPEDSDQVG
jgi:hypothetical protein